MSIALNILSVLSVYFFFCVVSVDREGRIFVVESSPWDNNQVEEQKPDPQFRLFGIWPVIPTILLVGLALFNKDHCSFKGDPFFSWQTGFAVATVLLVGPVFLGPALEVRKSVRSTSTGRYERPTSFMIYDWLVVFPLNMIVAWTWKLIMALVCAIFYLVASLTNSGAESYILTGVIAVWVILCQARISGIMSHRKLSYGIQPLGYLGMVFACAVVWELIEKALKGCGAPAGELPSYSSIFLHDGWMAAIGRFLKSLFGVN